MKSFLLVLILALFFSGCVHGNSILETFLFHDGTGGGSKCAGCTIVVALIEQMAIIHERPIEKILEDFCTYFPSPLQELCVDLVIQYGSIVAEMLYNKETPDAVCHALKMCTNATCHLYNSTQPHMKYSFKVPPFKLRPNAPWDYLFKLINKVFNDHLPLDDIDNDTFSNAVTFRGTSWRGKDCNDIRKDIYPGRRNTTHNAHIDHNCNGISGNHPISGKTYEDTFCNSVGQIGMILLGDSAGAHFSIPPEYITASKIGPDTYKDIIKLLENEGDWPQTSSSTGHINNKWFPGPTIPTDSYYLRLKQRNRCSHRDYQNIGVNGARSSSMRDIMKTASRSQSLDHPVTLFYALIGNDVCSPHPGGGHMTTPAEFEQNVLTALTNLETVLPMGSHVVFYGLVDGRILYDSMHNRIHPVGSVKNDITYKKVYDFLNCLQVNPCWGWLNSDPYWRDATTQRAFELNDVYKKIVATKTYKHFDLTYFDIPLQEIITLWQQRGGEAWQLIEPVDGFHPNQQSGSLLSEYMWGIYEKNYPHLIGPENPNNAEIERIFGDQGGY